MKLDTDFAEIKTEVVIDRITSHAMPRSQERVPAGVEFEFELVASLYDNENGKRLELVLEAMQLLEGDFLGGQGSRGSGKIEFCNLSLEFVPTQPYDLKKSVQLLKEKSLAQVVEDMSWLQQIQEQLKPAKA
jgi:CRISPR-associated protein Csm3